MSIAVEDMIYKLNKDLKKINVKCNRDMTHTMYRFMYRLKIFIEKYNGMEGFISYNNYLRIKKIQRLEHE